VKSLKAIKDGCLIPLIAIILVGWTTSYFYSYKFWSGALPKEISVGRKLKTETPLIISPGGSAGYAVFKLNSSTANKIKLAGINYFGDKTRPRKWDS